MRAILLIFALILVVNYAKAGSIKTLTVSELNTCTDKQVRNQKPRIGHIFVGDHEINMADLRKFYDCQSTNSVETCLIEVNAIKRECF